MARDRYWLRIGSDYLDDAKPHPTLASAKETFAETARELARYDQPIEASVHVAEFRSELAEYPDYLLRLGPLGGVRCERVD